MKADNTIAAGELPDLDHPRNRRGLAGKLSVRLRRAQLKYELIGLGQPGTGRRPW